MTHLALSEQGYWVFPTTGRRKYPVKLGGKEFDVFIDDEDHELAHAHLLQSKGTGAVLCPQSSDPVPLLILDLDTYGMSFDDLWLRLASGEAPPPTMGLVETPSGGYHLWFRLPPELMAERLPATVDFGNGVAGEVRVSSKARRLIMLPDSLATNKQKKPGKYRTVMGDVYTPSSLAFPPDVLIARLVARKDQGKTRQTKKGKPTEAIHFIGLLEHLAEAIPEGGRNNFVAKVGQVLGRLHPGTQVDQELMPGLWEHLKPRLGEFSEKEFRTAIASGWSVGSKNGEKYQAREKHPTVTDVKAECEGVFGAVPWMVEVFDSQGKLKETLVGFGGSAKRRNEAKKVTALADLRNLLPALATLAGSPLDTVARSPLFIQPGWARALDFMLHAEKGVDILGIPLEERFWTIIEEWARTAAADLTFLEAWTAKRPSGMAVPFVVWPKGEESLASLVLSPYLQEILMTQLGDISKTKKMCRQFLGTKTLVGMQSKAKVMVCSLALLPDEAQEFIGAQYETYVRLKAKEDKDAEGSSD